MSLNQKNEETLIHDLLAGDLALVLILTTDFSLECDYIATKHMHRKNIFGIDHKKVNSTIFCGKNSRMWR